MARHRVIRLIALSCLALAGWAGTAHAQLNTNPVRIVVPFPAGGTADVLPRILAEELRPQFPAGIVIENRSGAGGNIGADFVFRSEPDGTTLLASPPGPIAINHHLYKQLSFDPTRWVPITILASVPNVMAVSPNVKAKTVQEFIDYAKANPGKVTFASQGNGSTSHLTAALFMSLTDTQMIHVPYKGTAPALVGLMGGQVDVFFDNLASSMQHHRAGKLRILAVADAQRSKALPDVPTFVQTGLQGMDAVTWFALVAPPGTPVPLVDSYQQAVAKALADPEVARKFAQQGAEPRGESPAEAARFIRAEIDKWQKVITSANVTTQ